MYVRIEDNGAHFFSALKLTPIVATFAKLENRHEYAIKVLGAHIP